MQTPHFPHGSVASEATMKRLFELASLLGCEPDAFFEGRTGNVRLDQSSELWRLWSLLSSDEKREQVLAIMRDIARS